MSDDIDTAIDGAVTPEAAPVQDVQAETPQEPAPEETPEQRDDRARDEKGRFQSRINQVIAERGRAERELVAARAEIEALRAQSQRPSTPDKVPRLEEYEDVNAWTEAVTQYAVAEAGRRAQTQYQQQTQQQQQAQMLQQYQVKERAYAQAHPDYMESVHVLGSAVQFDPRVLEVIAVSDHGPAVLHHLAANLDMADRISRLPPTLAAAELARIEARITAPRPAPVSSAPPPAPAVRGGGATIQRDPDKLSMSEWMKWRENSLKRT